MPKSPHLSEQDEDEQQQQDQDILNSSQVIKEDDGKQKQTETQITTEPSETIEEQATQYKQQLSTEQVALSFPQQLEQDDNEPLKRPQEWTQSSFQRDEIYGNKYRPTKYSTESPSEVDVQLSSNYEKQTELESPKISHVQRSNIISRTVPFYPDEEELEHQEENDFRPTHLDISIPNEIDENLSKTSPSEAEIVLSSPNEQTFDIPNQYDKVLLQTSNDIVTRILKDAISETTEQEKHYSLYQTATGIVNDVIDNVYTKYEDELISSQREEATSADVSISDLTDWSSLVKNIPDITTQEKPTVVTTSGSDQEEELHKDEYLTSDDEEKEKFTSHDEPDVGTSKSTHELGDLVQDLQTLEEQINENVDMSHSLSSSSISENDEIHHYDLHTPQITTTSVNEVTDLLPEEQIQDIPISSKSINDRLQEEENLQSTNIDTLSRDIIQYRRDSQSNPSDNYSHRTERRPSSPPTSPLLTQHFVHITCSSMNDVDQVQQQLQDELGENKILQDMIDMIITKALENIHSEVSNKLFYHLRLYRLRLFHLSSHYMFHN